MGVIRCQYVVHMGCEQRSVNATVRGRVEHGEWRCNFDPMESTILERGPYRYVEEGEGTPLVLLHGLFGA